MGTTGLSLADLPNILIMIMALVALFIMLVILLRNMAVIGIVGEGANSPEAAWRSAVQPPRLLMQRVHIPFTFKLMENKPISYTNISCVVSSTVKYWSASWWGAPVRELHRALWGPLSEIYASENLSRHCDSRTPLNRSIPHEEKLVQFKLNEPLQLGPPPRSCYPLVVILGRDQQETEELRPDDTVALVSVIHIQDEQCPLPSGILAQYLKQANGQLSCLKQLYVSGECAEGNYEEAGALCCVCAARPLSRALLPCRHACLCSFCFSKLDKCPICRSIITSYFCIRSEDEIHSGTELKPPRLAFNRRLLDLFHYH